ncbi:NADH-quinone oxidoreductase subunit A [Marinoscillum furvescens]|uniref:NADH-quinone oxidoreductase subunit A n=1 Tax=Marinoscillum furvescens DSM 4134 TaxID=1122208 RepID=A0A3D9L636_MARFU|nr:NADH-quinone oxidoreductase subunit A [Marinoscillum furvescens]RED99892.1 NADH dehydrogenase subunit A [Marinoscillum furvescens DSM 4134]
MIELSGFAVVLLFIIGAAGFVVTTMLVGKILRPVRPNEEKNTTYESGEDPVKSAWGVFNIRFYVIALIFLLFETELVFLFPWATVFANEEMNASTDGLWGMFSLVETFIFIGILLLGLVYVWAKGMLDWVKPKPQKSTYRSRIPASAYAHINQKSYEKKQA